MVEQDRYKLSKRVSIISMVLNVILSILKVVVGIKFFSKALIADGLHSVSDLASTIVVLMSIRVSQSPADNEHPYGHGKAEAVGTTILAIMLLLTGFVLIKDTSVNIFNNKAEIPGQMALWVALISIITKEGLYRYTVKIGKAIESNGLVADAHHHRSDALSSVAALIGIGGSLLGFPILDPLAGLIVALFIAKIGFDILREAINELMDGVTDENKLTQFRTLAQEIQKIKQVGDIKLRNYGPKKYIDLTVVVDNNLSVVEGHKVASQVKEKIQSSDPSVAEVLVHVDPE